jgi:hypothetical protein
MRLSVVCQLGELRDIDIRDDTFSARIRLFMLWHPEDDLLNSEQRSFWNTFLGKIKKARGARGRESEVFPNSGDRNRGET